MHKVLIIVVLKMVHVSWLVSHMHISTTNSNIFVIMSSCLATKFELILFVNLKPHVCNNSTKGIHGRVLINTLHWCLIDTRLTLPQHLDWDSLGSLVDTPSAPWFTLPLHLGGHSLGTLVNTLSTLHRHLSWLLTNFQSMHNWVDQHSAD